MQTPARMGQRFGNYRLTRLLGKGGHAAVYLAENVELPDLQYAIKILTGVNLAGNEQKEFRDEANIVINLRRLNPHIVNIVDFGIQESKREEGGVPYFVMEYASEGTLRRRYPRGSQVPFDRIVLYVKQVAEALQCAHDNHVMHLDVKPENMLLWNADFVLLSDFGIAIVAQTGQLKPQDTVAGTAVYMAPERLTGVAERASDQYSLGIVVYEWLCGYPPFTGNDAVEICSKHIVATPPALHSRYPHITQEIEDVVMRALKKQPNERYSNVLEFARALEQAISHASQQDVDAVSSAIDMDITDDTQDIQQSAPSNQQQRGQKAIPVNQSNQLQGNANPSNSVISNSGGSQQGSASHAGQSAQQQAPPLPIVQPPLPPPPLPIMDIALPATQSSNDRIRAFFEFAPEFATDRRYSVFRNLGTILNVVSVLLATLLMSQKFPLFAVLMFALVCLIYLIFMFSLCVRAVETALAIFFGVLIALYWGFFGGILGNYIASRLSIDALFPLLFFGLIFFASSLGLHIWYVSRKSW